MSGARFVFPRNRLGGQLRAPGGVAVADAMEAVRKNLEEIRPLCQAELKALIDEAEACFARFPAEFDAACVIELYAIAARGVGAGGVCEVPAADTALISLCDLLDNFRMGGQSNNAAVAVHLRTLRLLILSMGRRMNDAEASAMLSGLQKVSARYARPAEREGGMVAAAG